MPTVTADFMDPHFWQALGTAIGYGLGVLIAISVSAAVLTFASGGTAPKHWPKRDDPHVEVH